MNIVEYQDKIDKIINKLEELEKYYYDCSEEALKKGFVSGAQIHSAEASAFGRAVWIVEDMAYDNTEINEVDLDE